MQSTSLHGEKDYFNNCIGSLEHHVHNVFASVRVPGEGKLKLNHAKNILSIISVLLF